MDLKLVRGLMCWGHQKDEEVSVAGYGRNREGGRRASGGVGVLMNRSLESRVSSAREWLVCLELRGEGRRKLMIGVVYVDPESESRKDGEAI